MAILPSMGERRMACLDERELFSNSARMLLDVVYGLFLENTPNRRPSSSEKLATLLDLPQCPILCCPLSAPRLLEVEETYFLLCAGEKLPYFPDEEL